MNNFENNFKAIGANPFALTYTNGTITKNYLDTGNGSYLDKVSLDVTTSVGKNPVNWSFNPIKMGDVNCSASNSSAARMAPASIRYPMTTNIRNTDLTSQSTKTLILKAQYAGQVSSFQLGLNLTPTKLQIKNVLKGDLNSANDEFDFEKTDNGEVRALWYNNKGKNKSFTEGVILMKFKVKSLTNVQNILNELKLDDVIVQNEFYDEKGNTASVKLSLEIDNNSSINDDNPYIVKVYPNPFNNDLTFDINAPKSEDATISIYNSFGGIVYTSKQKLNVGSNLIKISNAPSFPIGSFEI